MTASSATTITAAISFLNLIQKTRASSAASREGGKAVGMVNCRSCARQFQAARGSSYATRNFPAQARGKTGDACANDFILMTPDELTPAMQNPEKDPEEWTTGKEPMTGPQRSYLQTLCREAGEEFDETLTKAAASRKIEELQAKTGRGKK